MKKTILALMLLVGVVQAADTYEPRESDGRLMVAPERPVRAPHNYLEVAYDVEPYMTTPVPELQRLICEKRVPPRSGSKPFSNNIEEDWRVLCNVFQALHLRGNPEHVLLGFDGCFTSRRNRLRLPKPGPMGFLMDSLKRTGWVYEEDAERLGNHLTTGLQITDEAGAVVDLIPVQTEWARFWLQRAELLRSSPLWYVPVDSGRPKTQAERDREQAEIFRLARMVLQTFNSTNQ